MAAAPSSKPGAVHFWLIAFVMLTLILLVTTIMFYRDLTEKTAVADAAKKSEGVASAALNTTLADLEAFKAGVGYNEADIGVGNPAPANTARDHMARDLTTFGANLSQPTMSATLAALRSALDALIEENKGLKVSLQSEKDAHLAAITGANNRVGVYSSDKDKSEADLTKLVKERDELVRQKDAEIAKWQQSYRTEQVEKEQIRDELARLTKELNERISRLNQIVDFQRQQLDDLKKDSFDVPDGRVTTVDNTTGTVWLNLGRKDGLRTQVTFAVYGKSNKGIARGPEDVKAKIEVVEVRDTSSIARIVEEERDRPVGIGDVIFSPAWSAGLKEYFAFVGEGDLNNDGVMDSKDRKILKDMLSNAGAEMDVEITNAGLREPADSKLTVHTKWLVVGDVGDPASAVNDQAKLQRILAVQKQHEMLVQEAREHGIKIVSLKDFLTYMGWKPESRLYIPGSDAPFKLKAGAHSTGVNDTLGDRTSGGATSKAIMLKPKK